jgi:hypothetical protein
MESLQAPSVSLAFTFYSSSLLRSVPPILIPTTEVTISTSPDVGATFEATGHLIPQVDIGLSALGGIASTTVFLNLDASADFTVSTTSIASPQPCVNASSDLNVGVGAQGSFFDLFNASVGTSLFDKEFPLFQVRARSYHILICFPFYLSFPSPPSPRQKCFGPANPSSTAPPATVTLSSLRRRHDSPRARHLALFGGSLRPLHAKRLDLSCP